MSRTNLIGFCLAICLGTAGAFAWRAAGVAPFVETEVAAGVSYGPKPAGDEAFAVLRRAGVVTVVSVDAATPNVHAARRHGIRYIHVPIRYNGMTEAQQHAVAAALHHSDGPVFVHCHHGKHRAPTAAAHALIALGIIDNSEGSAILKTAGTSPSYPGLHACVGNARQLTADELEHLATVELPEIAPVTDTASGMATIDHAWDVLAIVRANGWRVPEEHPDAAPAAEAGVVHDVLRSLAEPRECAEQEDAKHPATADTNPAYQEPEYRALLARSIIEASELEAALVTQDPAAAEIAWNALGTTCIACHQLHRN